MAIKSCKIKTTGAKVGMDNKYRRTYTQLWHVVSDDETDTPLSILVGISKRSPDTPTTPNVVPLLWENYTVQDDTDLDVYLQSIEINRFKDDEQDRLNWIVTGTFSAPEPGKSDSAKPAATPLSDPVRYSLEWANYTKLVDMDKDGTAILNSAGDGFDPPIEIDDARPVLVAVRNMASLTDIIALAILYKNAVNTDTFYGATARKAKVESIVSGAIQERNGVEYYAVTIRVQFNDATWDKQLVDRGTQCYDYDLSNKIPVRVLDGIHKGERMEIANLNSNGTQRLDGLTASYKSPAFRIYPEKAFSGLGI